MDFPHRLVIERATAGADNDHGLPAQTWSTLSTVWGWVQPKRAEEMAQPTQAGPVSSDHSIYLWPTDVREADRVRFATDDGRRYQVDAVWDEAGIEHHLKLDAHMVTT
jgi:SPP1 family predicted phage head-tail adaptor